jgi:hypothetical protein
MNGFKKLSDADDGRAENRGRTAFYNGRPISDWKACQPHSWQGAWIRGFRLARVERESVQ